MIVEEDYKKDEGEIGLGTEKEEKVLQGKSSKKIHVYILCTH